MISDHPFSATMLDSLAMAAIEAMSRPPTAQCPLEELLVVAMRPNDPMLYGQIRHSLALVDLYAELSEHDFETTLRMLHPVSTALYGVMDEYEALCDQFGANTADDKVGGTPPFYAYAQELNGAWPDLSQSDAQAHAQQHIRRLHADRCIRAHD